MSPLYPAVMLASLSAGWLMLKLDRERMGLERSSRWAVGWGAFCGSMLGAKAAFLLIDGLGGGTGGASLLDGGKTIVGGLAGGYFGVELVKWARGVTTKTGDAFAAPVAVSVALGRLGCFVGKCCYGLPTTLPWGVDFGDGRPRHPTQLYEFLFHASMAALLFFLRRRGLLRYQLIKLYIVSYLAYRFATEFIRPEPRILAGLTGYQLGALALVPVFAALWRLDDRRLALEAAHG